MRSSTGSLRSLSARDRALIAILKENGRITWTDAAARLGVSRAAVQNRVDALRVAGWIECFTVQLGGPRPSEPAVEAFLRVRFDSGHDCFALFGKFGGDEMVIGGWAVTGTWDAVLHLRADTLEAISEFRELLVEDGGISKIETEAVLNDLSRRD